MSMAQGTVLSPPEEVDAAPPGVIRVSLRRVGNSFVITVPPEIRFALGLEPDLDFAEYDVFRDLQGNLRPMFRFVRPRRRE